MYIMYTSLPSYIYTYQHTYIHKYRSPTNLPAKITYQPVCLFDCPSTYLEFMKIFSYQLVLNKFY